MKQTKPYGRAFRSSDSGSSSPPPSPALSVDIPLPVTVEDSGERPALDIGEQFSATEAASPLPLPVRMLAYSLGALVVLAVYVWIRDSLFAQNLINMVTTRETVMICLEGTMRYHDWSIWDRLVGNGYFACTDWKVQTRFGSIPRF